MAVYSHRVMTQLNQSLTGMARDYFARVILTLSPEEFVDAFIAPDHVQKLKEIETLVGFLGSSGTTTKIPHALKDFPIEIAFHGRPPVILPKYIVHGMQPTCSASVQSKLGMWAAERFRLGAAFGLVKQGMNYLNDYLYDAETLTLFLPCFPYIMSRIDTGEESKTGKRAQALQSKKRAGAMPRLPREVKDQLQEASSIVSSLSLLMGSEVPEIPRNHARIDKNNFAPLTTTNPFAYLSPGVSSVIEVM